MLTTRSRWLCMALVLICLSGCAQAQTPDPMTALPTPTPEPPVGLVPSETEEEAPTSDEASAMPAAPGDTPDEENAASVPSDGASDLPSDMPDEARPEASVDQTDDESQADHLIIQIAPDEAENEADPIEVTPDMASETPLPIGPAPVCETEGCPHIWPNEQGDVAAVCELGRWMLDLADMEGADAEDAVEDALEDDADDFEWITLENGVNVIYCGGHYALSGGGEYACLYVREGLRVALLFENAELLTLKLSDGVSASIRFSGRNRLETLAANGAKVDISGTGLLTVRNNLNCDSLTVRGGSVFLPRSARSLNGWQPVRFEAEGAREATLDGAFLTELECDETGAVTVWLPPREGGYTGAMNGNTLEIQSPDGR